MTQILQASRLIRINQPGHFPYTRAKMHRLSNKWICKMKFQFICFTVIEMKKSIQIYTNLLNIQEGFE